jgi:DNA-binding transcriptional LysR family regulator
MDLVRIQCVWSYLPSFLAVAESQHLRRAARELHVSPSALSRSISILEHRIGQPLFERSAGRMRLNSLGNELLKTVREVVRLVDATLARNDSTVLARILPRDVGPFETGSRIARAG